MIPNFTNLISLGSHPFNDYRICSNTSPGFYFPSWLSRPGFKTRPAFISCWLNKLKFNILLTWPFIYYWSHIHMLDGYTSIKAVYAHINDIHDVIITVLSRKRMLYHWLCTELDTQEEWTLPSCSTVHTSIKSYQALHDLEWLIWSGMHSNHVQSQVALKLGTSR